MMASIGVEDFSLRDLIAPESKRLLRHLSTIINFWRFRTERMEPLDHNMARTVRNHEHRGRSRRSLNIIIRRHCHKLGNLKVSKMKI